MNLDSNVDLKLISEMCADFSGADIKSVVCDALVKGFHRAHSELTLSDDNLEFKSLKNEGTNILSQDKLRISIKICENDLVSSINAIKKTINKNERIKLKKL